MFTLIVENLRSFEGRHEIEIKPLTLLVGENSSGKSTLLAAISAVTDSSFPMRLPVNDPPYNLGSYATIATYKGGSYGRAKHFCLGYRIYQGNDNSLEYIARFEDDNGAAVLTEVSSTISNLRIKASICSDGTVWTTAENVSNSKPKETIRYCFKKSDLHDFLIPFNLWHFAFRIPHYEAKTFNKPQRILLGQLLETPATILSWAPFTQSLSPARTKPKRTYDKIELTYSPEGEHIPYIIEDGILSHPRLAKTLIQFGKASGLFSEVSVRNGGKSRAQPRQVEIGQVGSRPANLIDVGYGVSQALPVVVESIISSAINEMLLLQQPEVHLHPKAQAALGTFFCDMVHSFGRKFVIETHSDYILDRIRLEIAKGNIKLDAVSLVFAEKSGHNSELHKITIDKVGNIIDPPAGYRSFFLREQLDLLGR